MIAQPNIEKPMRLEAAAEFLSVSVKTLRRLIEAGKLQAFKIGGRWFIYGSHIQVYVQQQIARNGARNAT
jgi:excisionase family DNA binding protein